jgi:hypothetical protein
LGLFAAKTQWVSAAIGTLLACSLQAREPNLDEVLARAGRYVTEFERQLSGIVAEEQYVQEVRRFGRGPGRLLNPMRIELRSDLLLVRGAPAASWVQFRDVFEVDGSPVRDRTERLAELFATNPPSRDAQIRKILAESSRYNIGDIERNINAPLLALQFLEPANQPRFRFRRTVERQPTTVAEPAGPDGAFRVSVEMWVIQYEERQKPTIIRTTTRKDLPSRGRFWIDPATGQVLMSELVAGDRAVRATIDVSYQSEPLVGMLVPVEMRERYEGRKDTSLIEGRAIYGRFRQVPVDRR